MSAANLSEVEFQQKLQNNFTTRAALLEKMVDPNYPAEEKKKLVQQYLDYAREERELVSKRYNA